MQRTGDWSQLAKALGQLASYNTQDVAQEIGEALLASTQRRFQTGRAPDGTAWPKSVRVKEKGGQTLVQRRRLLRSITYQVKPGRVDVGTNDKRADVHQQGKTIKARRAKSLRFKIGRKWVTVKQVTMPKRPFIGLSEQDEKTVETIIQDSLKERLK